MTMPRREFIRSIGRYAAAAGLLGGAAVLVSQTQPAQASCASPSPCGDCELFHQCGLNRAAAFRQQAGQGGGK